MASRRPLKAVTHNFVASFTSLMNYRSPDYIMGHIIQAAWRTGATSFRIDLLTGEHDGSPLLTFPVRGSIKGYVKDFPDFVLRTGSDIEFVKKAELVVTVDPEKKLNTPYEGLLQSPFTCTISLTDDRGKIYEYKEEGWWFPENPPMTRSFWCRISTTFKKAFKNSRLTSRCS